MRFSHESSLPLAGVRILDITLVVGAPYGTMLLADMGAEVIRVETRQNFPSTTRGIWARPSKDMVVNGGAMGSGYPDMEPGERLYDVWEVNEDAEYHEAGASGAEQALGSERLVPQRLMQAAGAR